MTYHYKLISGDPIAPDDTDILFQSINLPLKHVPRGGNDATNGWRILSGNMHGNTWARVVLRYELTVEELSQ